MMKKKRKKRMYQYQIPSLEVIELAKEDVIVTSGLSVKGDDQNLVDYDWGSIWN